MNIRPGAKKREQERVRLELERDLAEKERELALEKATTDFQMAGWTAEYELRKLFHQSLYDASKGSIERARDSAKFVQTAAAAIGTIYIGVLGVSFSVTDNSLPLRGIFAPLFLGMAVAFSGFYLAFLTPASESTLPGPAGTLQNQQMHRLIFFANWVNRATGQRRYFIQASVMSLAVGLVFIVAPFVGGPRPPVIPDAPAPPSAPTSIDPAVRSQAVDLYLAQIDDFRQAAGKRNEAIADAAQQSVEHEAREEELNRWAIGLAAAGLLIVLVVPVFFSRDKAPGPRTRGAGRR
ncbi:hypothetical protein ACWEQV_28410 [Rhodococcus aetherivorans]|uniref:hypothetical protein n=1 Tax=Rhodococcus aetherivorans TaxID=191292 RepID=UPI00045D2851|nr:hypothetical protein [Rhodococcus aetherivorans]KDE11631.1 hypothetical protein N505_0118555 [Rhodococcus aetherivorans]MDV6293943.1 hypothetical protein [Rhodococcus aetherivorans]